MIHITPGAPHEYLGTLLSALIIVFSAIGLTMHECFYAGIRRKGFYCYFTNLSNLLVLLHFGLISPRLYTLPPLYPLIPHADFFVTANIMLTCTVFSSILMPPILSSLRGASLDRRLMMMACSSAVEHHIVPLLTLCYWLLCSPGKEQLGIADAWIWMLFPSLYLLGVLRRGMKGIPMYDTGLAYPYPFLDIGRYGAKAVSAVCIRLCAAAFVISVAAVAVVRLILSFR
ncbi:MAG: Pr6Pr family membrane protein [Clostridia bacterium]|nr:Pr6Pr family membrane protein [Clostridia bacterium]